MTLSANIDVLRSALRHADDVIAGLIESGDLVSGHHDVMPIVWGAIEDMRAALEETADAEPFIVTQPLSAVEFQKRIDADGRVRLAIPVSLDELYDCGGIDGFNDLVDSRLYGEGVRGCLSDLCYRPLRVLEDERVLIDVIARTEELELEVAAWRCRVCGEMVLREDSRDHLVAHNPNARSMDWEDVAAQFEGGTT